MTEWPNKKRTWRGIVLAGGAGTRLYPMTQVVVKQLLPVYDKPMICYPLSVLMLSGIRDILIISTPADLPRFRDFLGDGAELGLRFQYVQQDSPRGIADAFLLGADFIGDSSVCLVLGDNIFHGDMRFFHESFDEHAGATVFGYPVQNPEQYGVVELDAAGKPLSLEEKPADPKSKYAVVGLYCYDNDVVERARNLRPSARGELEITDLNRTYLEQGRLSVRLMSRGMAWLDTGTPEALLDAANFVATLERRQGFKIGCLEEVALRMGTVSPAEFEALAERRSDCDYRNYLFAVAREFREKEQR